MRDRPCGVEENAIASPTKIATPSQIHLAVLIP